MKKAFLILFLIVGTQIMKAHPGVEHHAHDSLIGEWAWLIIPFVALLFLGFKLTSRGAQKSGK
ncbi:MAG: hypothetical protein HKN31_15330 [Pricia sp.]|nr:hypothetical protein [Pricia sp.]